MQWCTSVKRGLFQVRGRVVGGVARGLLHTSAGCLPSARCTIHAQLVCAGLCQLVRLEVLHQ